MAERLDPVVRLVIEGKGWDGDEWKATTGEPGEVVIYPENARKVIEPLRAYLAERLSYNVSMVALKVAELDFTVPNLPDDVSLRSLVEQLEATTEIARCLHQLSPWDYDDDDGEEGEPEPDPDPAAKAGAG